MRLSQQTFRLLTLVGALLVSLPAAGSAEVIRVTPAGGSSVGCGDTWATACGLQHALQTEATSGDELWVMTGTYTPGVNRSDTFFLRPGVSLYGGFAGDEASRAERDWRVNPTVLSGEIGMGSSSDNCWHVVTANNTLIGADTVLDGFTVARGFADDPSWPVGGGLIVRGGSPTVSNCIFTTNLAVGDGGAVYVAEACTPAISDSIFSENMAQNGGALYATSDVHLHGCTFTSNVTANFGLGGAIRLASGTGIAPVISHCTFSGNSSVYEGGAISLTRANATIVNSTFSGNWVETDRSGGAIAYDQSGGTIVNSTFAGNVAGSVGGGAISTSAPDATAPTVVNSILWGNSPDQLVNGVSSLITLSTSIVQGGCPTASVCNGVIASDPKLAALGDYGGPGLTFLPAPGSPAIDAGDDAVCAAAPVSGASQNGLPRPQGAHCDIGAFEIGQGAFRSVGAYDGWVLESSEDSSKGGSINKADTTLFLGDDGANRQYRSIVSFDTAPLPDGAVITTASLRLRQAGLLGTNPLPGYGNLVYDMRRGGFSGSDALQVTDFQAAASLTTAGKIPKGVSGGWHSAPLGAAASGMINRAGQTQFRLRFTLGDNNDRGADVLKLHSGNAAQAYRPSLAVQYYVP